MRPFDPRLLKLVPSARVPVAVLGVVGVISGAATIGTAFALTALVVAVVEGAPLGPPAAWLAALFAVRAGLAGLTERVAAWAGVAVSTSLRSTLLQRWAGLDADTRPEPAAAVALATTGATTVEPYAARFLPTLVTASVVPVLAIATLVVVDWPSAVVVVLTVPLLPVFAALIGRATADETSKRWAALASLGGHFLDVVQGLPTLVTYGRAERQVATVREVSERHRRATMRTLRLAFLSSAALELLATISVAIVAVTVGLRLSTGSLALGPALVAILLAPEAFWPIRRVGAEFHAAADGAAALDDILTHLTPSPANDSFEVEHGGVPERSTSNESFAGIG
ncbi:MAG: thiol reductant ABC exporter subunit CydD, partial [Humibacillus sp.]|nr:thiol reductant ABC exporter subunit CydD [Humibacillus sp.]MDN5780079.1 thiol reductant ABC exporter subunit CydD [Humibacillus sp.]